MISPHLLCEQRLGLVDKEFVQRPRHIDRFTHQQTTQQQTLSQRPLLTSITRTVSNHDNHTHPHFPTKTLQRSSHATQITPSPILHSQTFLHPNHLRPSHGEECSRLPLTHGYLLHFSKAYCSTGIYLYCTYLMEGTVL